MDSYQRLMQSQVVKRSGEKRKKSTTTKAFPVELAQQVEAIRAMYNDFNTTYQFKATGNERLQMSREDELTQHLGPACYSPDKNAVWNKAPEWTIGCRHPDPNETDECGGPGAYDAQMSFGAGLNEFTIGVRREEKI